jgi:tRNA (guanine-N7-)-methyltransferase
MEPEKPLIEKAEAIRYELEPGEVQGCVEWSVLFGNDHPVEIEVGFGKGTFLKEASLAYPNRNYFGIEPSAKYVRLTRGRLERWSRPNVRVHRSEARYFFERFVEDGSVSAVHCYHPDPWPKRRHHKRRLIRKEFLSILLDKVRPGGRITVTTDHSGYFEFMQEELSQLNFERADFDFDLGSGPGEFITNFARKYMAEGRGIYRMEIRRHPRT